MYSQNSYDLKMYVAQCMLLCKIEHNIIYILYLRVFVTFIVYFDS